MQIVIDWVFLKLTTTKLKCWPKLPLNLGSLTIQNSTHVALLGNVIVEMNLGGVPKRRHDHNSLLENHFVQEHMKVTYVHEEQPGDSIYKGAINFSKVVRRISIPKEKTFIFQYQKYLKTKVLQFIQLQLTMEENVQKQNAENEAKHSLASSSSSPTEK